VHLARHHPAHRTRHRITPRPANDQHRAVITLDPFDLHRRQIRERDIHHVKVTRAYRDLRSDAGKARRWGSCDDVRVRETLLGVFAFGSGALLGRNLTLLC
jgi:hypothetical protein